MHAVTVFFVPDDSASKALAEAYRLWAAEGLVEEAAWVTPSGITYSAMGPPFVAANVINANGSTTEELFDYIGRQRGLTLVRLVAGRLLASDRQLPDPEFTRWADDVGRRIVKAAAQASEVAGHHTHVVRFNVMAPVSGVEGIDPKFVISGWDANVVVAAEDRADANGTDTYVRYPGNAVGHLLSALCGIGGVLRGIGQGPFDDGATYHSTTNGNEVMLARQMVRSVVGVDAETGLAITTLNAINAAEPHGAAQFQPWAIKYKPQKQLDIAAQIRTWLLDQQPWKATRVPTVGGETFTAPAQTPIAEAWAPLRSVTFAATDGGKFPKDFPSDILPEHAAAQDEQLHRAVLGEQYVVPDPLSIYVVAGREIHSNDPAAVNWAEQHFEAEISKIERRIAKLESQLAA